MAAAIGEVERARARERAWHERWGAGGSEGMTRLIRRFPTLRAAEGVEPWDVDRFLAWARRGEAGAGASCAARFVLSLWNAHTDWRATADNLGLRGGDPLEPFAVFEAVAVWDVEHVQAFISWVELPFWP